MVKKTGLGKGINLNLNFSNKTAYTLIVILSFLIVGGIVYAYNANMQGGTPSVMGHSSDEVMVRNSTNSLVSLQTLIDQGGLGGGSSFSCTDSSSTTYPNLISSFGSGASGNSYCSSINQVCVGVFYMNSQYADECSYAPGGATNPLDIKIRCCSGGGGGGSSLGMGSKLDSAGNPIVKNTLYRVTSDGFLIFQQQIGYEIHVRMGPTSSPPERFLVWGYIGSGATYPIYKDEYFSIDTSATLSSIYYQPIGSGSCVKQ